jgi:hypothetical protein
LLKKRVALAAAVLAALAFALTPVAASQGAIVGIGIGEVGPCEGHMIQFTGVNPAGNFWSFTFTEIGGNHIDCLGGNAGSVMGQWNFPSGCVQVAFGTGTFCLTISGASSGSGISAGVNTGTVSQVCGVLSGCLDGTATVTWVRVSVA